MKHRPHPKNAEGPFYVADKCCTRCDVPFVIANELFEAEEYNCYVKRQPESPRELRRMLQVIHMQEFDCIRYRGQDVDVMRRMVEMGESDKCDEAPPRDVKPVRRDHVSFRVVGRGVPTSGRAILDRFVRWLADAQPHTEIHGLEEKGSFAWLIVGWSGRNRYDVEAVVGERHLVRHEAPPLFSETIHDWLESESGVVDIRWQTKDEWVSGGAWNRLPW